MPTVQRMSNARGLPCRAAGCRVIVRVWPDNSLTVLQAAAAEREGHERDLHGYVHRELHEDQSYSAATAAMFGRLKPGDLAAASMRGRIAALAAARSGPAVPSTGSGGESAKRAERMKTLCDDPRKGPDGRTLGERQQQRAEDQRARELAGMPKNGTAPAGDAPVPVAQGGRRVLRAGSRFRG